jgi:hypothetical protein
MSMQIESRKETSTVSIVPSLFSEENEDITVSVFLQLLIMLSYLKEYTNTVQFLGCTETLSVALNSGRGNCNIT